MFGDESEHDISEDVSNDEQVGIRMDMSTQQIWLVHGLQSITFGHDFDQSLDNVTLLRGLQSISFGDGLNQGLDTMIFAVWRMPVSSRVSV